MQLPNSRSAHVTQEKVVEYLLSSTHADGQMKARFFIAHGFSVEAWQQFAQTLVMHAQEHPVARVEPSAFGVRYVVEGILHTPDGRKPLVRTVWFIETDETIPRVVTAYPLKMRED